LSDKEEGGMPVIGLRQLSRETSEVIQELLSSGEPVVITKKGWPVATLAPVDETQVQDLVLSLAPSIKETSSITKVDVSPAKTRTLDKVSRQLAKEAARSAAGRKAQANAKSAGPSRQAKKEPQLSGATRTKRPSGRVAKTESGTATRSSTPARKKSRAIAR